MLYRMKGEVYHAKGTGKFTVGDEITVESGDFAGLTGEILEIRTGRDKDTDNPGADIYCALNAPVGETRSIIEKRFSALYRKPMAIEDIALDEVILSPDMLASRHNN